MLFKFNFIILWRSHLGSDAASWDKAFSISIVVTDAVHRWGGSVTSTDAGVVEGSTRLVVNSDSGTVGISSTHDSAA